MLITEELKSRTYDERIGDVLQELPLLSSEWTNYNPSDPGITTLEYLTAFERLRRYLKPPLHWTHPTVPTRKRKHKPMATSINTAS